MFNILNLIKYMLEGLAVAVAAFYIPQKNMNVKEIAIIALTAAATFAILDMFSPFIGAGARQGAGFGIGYNMVTGGGFDEGFEGQEGGADESEDFEDQEAFGEQQGFEQEGGEEEDFEDASAPKGNDMGEDYAPVA